MKFHIFAAALCGQFLLTVSAIAQQATAAPSIEGQWHGYYFGRSGWMSVRMQIAPSAKEADSNWTGSFDFDIHPRPDPNSNVIHIHRDKGVFDFQLDHDPHFGAFRFQPGTWSEGHPKNFATSIVGMHRPDKDVLVGLLYWAGRQTADPSRNWRYFICFRPGAPVARAFEDRFMKEPSREVYNAERNRYGVYRRHVDQLIRFDRQIPSTELEVSRNEAEIQRIEREIAKRRKTIEAKQANWEALERSLPQEEKRLERLRTVQLPATRQALEKLRAEREALAPPAGFEVPTPEVLEQWYSIAREEFPDYDPQAFGSATGHRIGLLLCDEPRFSEAFGYPREKLGEPEQLLMERGLQAYFVKEPAMVGRLKNYLATNQKGSEVSVYLAAKPLLHEAVMGLESQLAALSGDADSVDRINRLEARIQLLEDCFWPSEWETVRAMLELGRASAGIPALAMAVDRLLEQARGPEEFDALVTWRDSHAELVAAAPETDLTAQQERINRRLLTLLEPAMTAEIARLDTLEESSKWYQRRQSQLAFATDTPAYAAMIASLLKRRAELLSSPDEQLVRSLGGFSDIGSLENYRASLLVFPGDASSPGGEAITRAANDRILALRKHEVSHMYSKAELALMNHEMEIELPPSAPSPTPEEMTAATLRSIASGQPKIASLRSIDSLRISLNLFEGIGDAGNAGSNPLEAMFKQIQSGCLRASAEPVALTEADLDVLGELGMTRADIGKSSFRTGPLEHLGKATTTTYAFAEYSDIVSPEVGRMINAQLRAETKETSTGIQLYRLTKHGWIVPGLAEEIAKDDDLLNFRLMQEIGRDFVRDVLEDR